MKLRIACFLLLMKFAFCSKPRKLQGQSSEVIALNHTTFVSHIVGGTMTTAGEYTFFGKLRRQSVMLDKLLFFEFTESVSLLNNITDSFILGR
jgi:hypothetical protein